MGVLMYQCFGILSLLRNRLLWALANALFYLYSHRTCYQGSGVLPMLLLISDQNISTENSMFDKRNKEIQSETKQYEKTKKKIQKIFFKIC